MWKPKTTGLVTFMVIEMATQIYENLLSGSLIIMWEQTNGVT